MPASAAVALAAAAAQQQQSNSSRNSINCSSSYNVSGKQATKQARTSLARFSHGQRQFSAEQQQKCVLIVSYSYAATICWQQTPCNCFKVLLQGCSNSRSTNSSNRSGNKGAATAAAAKTVSAAATMAAAATM